MFAAHTPAALLSQSLDQLIGHLPGVRDGSVEAIHQARVSLRRLREAMRVMRGDFAKDQQETVEDRLSAVAHVLSRARDADVVLRLVQKMETRLPLAARPLARLRAATIAEQSKARRKAIKKLEALNLGSLPASLRLGSRNRFGLMRSGWRHDLRDQIHSRADRVRESVAHAGGVYFPNRLHSARVAIKQLRYTLELAAQAGTLQVTDALPLLRDVQDALGKAHDREMLLARLGALDADREQRNAELEAIEQYVRAETLAYHEKYLAQRPNLLAVCDACTSAPRGLSRRSQVLVAAGLAVPSVLLLRRAASSHSDSRKPSQRPAAVRRAESA